MRGSALAGGAGLLVVVCCAVGPAAVGAVAGSLVRGAWGALLAVGVAGARRCTRVCRSLPASPLVAVVIATSLGGQSSSSSQAAAAVATGVVPKPDGHVPHRIAANLEDAKPTAPRSQPAFRIPFWGWGNACRAAR